MMADSTGTPTIVSASSTARRIELTASSRLTICPLRQPFDSAAPSAANFTPPSSSSSPIRAHVFVLPMSSATMCRSFFANAPLLTVPQQTKLSIASFRTVVFTGTGRFRAGPRCTCCATPARSGFTTASPLKRKSTDSTRPAVDAPLAHFFDQRFVLGFEIAVTEMNEDGSIRLCPRNPAELPEGPPATAPQMARLQAGQRGAQIMFVREIHFAYLFQGARSRRIQLLQESGKKLHALLALVSGHFGGNVRSRPENGNCPRSGRSRITP